MEFLTEETTRKLKKINTERYRHTNKKEIEIGDIVTDNIGIGTIEKKGDKWVEICWGTITDLYPFSEFRKQIKNGNLIIYKEVSIGDLNI